MSWQALLLGEVIRLKRGHDLPAGQRKEGSVPIVSSSGITGYHNVAKAPGPGVVTGRYGTLGEVHYIEGDYWPLNTALYVEDFRGNYPRYIAYLLSTLELGTKNAAGAVPGVNRNTLHQMPVSIPCLTIQKTIASVLSAYDDLIAANQRRIQLLEESARLLYREWFVKLRFPGHETVPVVDGVPEGWEKKPLGEFVTLNYGKGLKEADRVVGGVPVYGSSGIVGHHNKPLITGPAIIVGRKGNVDATAKREDPTNSLNH
ncbi:restriction endonuclease subunit S [Trichloromonas sp.]|uniref:restriction endonuclease subunit S n=1 Tax=Trichloromonas sp. TaxID=3069249 RepID=UPI002A484007|nr:restriction endonuclease subunit S [Trichloromonas sp.]